MFDDARNIAAKDAEGMVSTETNSGPASLQNRSIRRITAFISRLIEDDRDVLLRSIPRDLLMTIAQSLSMPTVFPTNASLAIHPRRMTTANNPSFALPRLCDTIAQRQTHPALTPTLCVKIAYRTLLSRGVMSNHLPTAGLNTIATAVLANPKIEEGWRVSG